MFSVRGQVSERGEKHREEGRGGEKKEEKREKKGRERVSGTLPACRSNMKNDFCSRSDRQGRMDPVLHQRHYVTFPADAYLHTSYVHTHIAAVNHLLQQEGYVMEFPLKSLCSTIQL